MVSKSNKILICIVLHDGVVTENKLPAGKTNIASASRLNIKFNSVLYNISILEQYILHTQNEYL